MKPRNSTAASASGIGQALEAHSVTGVGKPPRSPQHRAAHAETRAAGNKTHDQKLIFDRLHGRHPGEALPRHHARDEDDADGYEADEKFNLIEDDVLDTDCTDGKIYTVTRTLSTAGTHNYRFYASDGSDDATGAPTSDSTVTVMLTAYNPPYLEWVTAD